MNKEQRDAQFRAELLRLLQTPGGPMIITPPKGMPTQPGKKKVR